MSGLLDVLLTSPGPEDRLMQVMPFLQGSRPPSPGGYGSPPGGGIFGNDSVDVLDPNDPRLRTLEQYGVTLARPAARSLLGLLQQYGYKGDAGGGYRSAAEQAALKAAKPGLAAPVGSSFHQEGLAIDLAAALQNPRFFQMLRQAGWQQLDGEPWHWTYGTYG